MVSDLYDAIEQYAQGLMESEPGSQDRWRGAALLHIIDRIRTLETVPHDLERIAAERSSVAQDADGLTPDERGAYEEGWLAGYREAKAVPDERGTE